MEKSSNKSLPQGLTGCANSAANGTLGAHMLRLLYSCYTPCQEFVASIPSFPGLKSNPRGPQKSWRIELEQKEKRENKNYENQIMVKHEKSHKKWVLFHKNPPRCMLLKNNLQFCSKRLNRLQISFTWV